MMGVNKVILIGNLGKDPEVRSSAAGDKIVNMTIATSEKWKDRGSGETKEKTEWHRVVIFNQVFSDLAEKYLRKGSPVYVEGKLQTRKWTDQSGIEKYSTEIVLGQYGAAMTLLGNGDDNRGQGGGGHQQQHAPAASRPRPGMHESRTGPGFNRGSDLDDEIPF